MSRTTVLVVDDDPLILRLVSVNLKASHYDVLLASDGESAIEIVGKQMPDLILLDIIMPGIDGDEVCRQIREWSAAPIIVISAKEKMADKVRLLDLGVDDYLTKPFGVEELLARVRAVLRRKLHSETDAVHTTSTFTAGNLEINFATQRVTVSGKDVHLTPIEYDILMQLALNVDKVLTHKFLLDKVWGGGFWDSRTYLRVYIRRLRRKIEPNARNPEYILTRTGVGYCLQSTPPEVN